MANFRRLTRYTGGVLSTDRSGNDFLVLRRPLNLEPKEGDVFVQIDAELENRPDLVAQKAYGNPRLWWVIYEFNGIRDPLFELRRGTILRIPEQERVIAAVEALEDA